jgi:hypothetical protein
VRRERVDVRASEASFTLPPAPAAPPVTETAEVGGSNHPGQP